MYRFVLLSLPDLTFLDDEPEPKRMARRTYCLTSLKNTISAT